LDVDDELSAFNDDDTGDYDPRKSVVAAAPAKMAIVGEFNDDDDDDDFREDKKPDATGVTVAENDFEDEFVFLEDSNGEEETGWEEDDENRDFEDDDGLFLTDADDSLTRKTAAQAKGASVKSCRYLQSCVRVKDCPPPKYPEIAVIGRSNVGKSSLINMLTGRTKKEVAKTSKNPGKTQTINHFEMVTGDGTWYLTDLPGYGFANAPEKQRRQWALFTREYLLERENLIAVMLLIDSTVKPQRLDLECLEFLGENDVPVTVVFTKVDKKRKVKSGVRARPEENVEMFCREVSEYWEEMPPMIFTSSKTGDGKQSVLNHVATLRQFFKESENGAR
jgi:GTP-binding protein